MDIAAKYDQLILIHTPHLEDKHKGTSIITSILKNDKRIKPERVLVDHCEEHTFRMAKENGFWAGLTIYPVSKVTPQRATRRRTGDVHGTQMVCVNSASDWGESGPTNLTDTCLEFRRRGHSEAEAIEVFYNNPCKFFGQSPKWKFEADRRLSTLQDAVAAYEVVSDPYRDTGVDAPCLVSLEWELRLISTRFEAHRFGHGHLRRPCSATT